MRVKDEAGNVYGRLTVLRQAGVNKYKIMCWLCQCACGNQKIISGYSLRRGNSKSCGCSRGYSQKPETIVVEKRSNSGLCGRLIILSVPSKEEWAWACAVPDNILKEI